MSRDQVRVAHWTAMDSEPVWSPRLVAALGLCGCLVLSACTSASSGGEEERVRASARPPGPAPSSRRRPQEGRRLLRRPCSTAARSTLSQDAGKVVVVNFWARGAGRARSRRRSCDRSTATSRARARPFVGIDTKDDRDNAKSFLVRRPASPIPIVYDSPGKTHLKLGNPPASLPFTVLIDKTGRVAAVYFGGPDAEGPRARSSTRCSRSGERCWPRRGFTHTVQDGPLLVAAGVAALVG